MIILKISMRLFTLQRLPITPQSQTLENVKLPTLSPDDALSLEGNISDQEIEGAIKAMNNSKAPGPDGLPLEFYKNSPIKLYLC